MNRIAWLLAVVAATGLPGTSWGLTCAGRIVSTGDRRIEVLGKCGEPSWREERLVETAERHFLDTPDRALLDERRVVSTVEEWVYNFGPSRLLYFLTFQDGRLTDVRTGGYGYTEGPVPEPGTACWAESLARGRSKPELLRYCGQPASIDVRHEERGRTTVDRAGRRLVERRAAVAVEEWTYNFGPHRLLYVFTLENGRVVDVKTAGYGF
ncbi:MAG: DUF2845 domain-containing protein [Deferrisomatales bacterium]|nr:DUF2845 domain-containing protein [Deferrisomatales bacterium]